jgi:plastocyanin
MGRTRTSCLGFAIAALVATAAAAGAEQIRPGGVTIAIGPGGPSPSSVRTPSPTVFGWVNEDSVAHTVTLDGRCTLTIQPGESAACRSADAYKVFVVGTYRYRVSGTAQPEGEIVVTPNLRQVTLAASRARVRAGEAITFRGTVVARQMDWGLYPGPDLNHPVTLFRRVAGSRRFRAVGRSSSERDVGSCTSLGCVTTGTWSVTVRATATATYVARSSGDQIFQNAESRPVVVRVTSSS